MWTSESPGLAGTDDDQRNGKMRVALRTATQNDVDGIMPVLRSLYYSDLGPGLATTLLTFSDFLKNRPNSFPTFWTLGPYLLLRKQ